jgi:acetyl-CoA acyltransferase 1
VISGGSIALSHPLGMSESSPPTYDLLCRLYTSAGVRLAVTGIAELKRRDAKILCTSMCIGSGMGAAAIFVNEARR